MSFTVTVQYSDGRTDVHQAVDKLTTESAQWRMDIGPAILLVPMLGVRYVRMVAASGGSGGSAGVIITGSGGGGGFPGNFTSGTQSTTWTVP